MADDDFVLARLEPARRMLAECRDAPQAKKVADVARAAEIFARRQKLSSEAIEYAVSIRVDAETMMGAFLRPDAGNRHTKDQGRPNKSAAGEDIPPKLADLGITHKESSRAQFLADVAEKKPELHDGIRLGKVSVTEARRQVQKEERRETRAAGDLPTGKFNVIYADPPWKYGDKLTESYGGTQYHYESMSVAELCDLPVDDLAADDCVLFLWVTSPLLPDGLRIVEAWDFDYKACFVWDKIKHNMGHYQSVRHEFLLLCTRGSGLPDSDKLERSVVSIERGEHSAKPAYFRAMIERMYVGRKVELFAREAADGWERWGNQA